MIRRHVLLCIAVGALAAAGSAQAFDKHDFTTTASTAGTTAYIVGKNRDDDFATARDFADSQRVALQREAAAGGGEHVASLGSLLGAEDNQAFGRWMQSHYDVLYPNEPVQANLADRIVALRHS